MFAIITDTAKGGTFLTWSIYYLSGATTYYHSKSNSIKDICANPINRINAHNFMPNQANTFIQFKKIFNDLLLRDDNSLDIIYFHIFGNDDNDDNTKNKDHTNVIHTKLAIETLKKARIKTLVLSSNNALYHCTYKMRSYGPSACRTKIITNEQDNLNDIIDFYFSNAKQTWENLNINVNNIWNMREFIALNFKPFDTSKLNIPTYNFNHYDIAAEHLWLNFDYLIDDVFNYLELSMDKQRHSSWLNVYNSWKNLHSDRIIFMWYFDKIIENILNGTSMDLKRFNLDIIREATIQHVLLYKHNMNIKTHQVETFTNTKQLHDLLEPNIYHDLS